MSAGAKAVLIICIVLAVLALTFTGIIIFVTVKNISSISSSQPELPQDFYDYGSNYGYDLYTPDADDEYYEELTDATTDGLSLRWSGIRKQHIRIIRMKMPIFRCITDFFRDHEERLESINGKVREMIHRYDGSYTEDGAVVSTVVYVTLMEEDRLSLVCKYEVSGKNDYYGLDALNMDMTTGTEIPNSTLLEVDDTLVTRFRVQNSKQNGSITWLDDMSDEELLKILSDDRNVWCF